MKAGGLALYNLIQPTISLEMPVPSQGHYGFPVLLHIVNEVSEWVIVV
jgi:hypothetical protein